jgi:two-component system sporulation sensor kinase A
MNIIQIFIDRFYTDGGKEMLELRFFRRLGGKRPFKATLVYILSACLWTFLSDYILFAWTNDAARITQFQTLKGWFFILVTGIILFILLYCYQKRQEDMTKTLIETEAKYRTLVEEALVGVYIYQDGRYCYVNPRFCEIMGYSQDEIVAGDAFDLILPEDRPLVVEQIQRQLNGECKSMRYQARGRRRDGTIIHFEVHGTITTFHDKPAIIGTLIDLTERKKTEDLLRKSDKLAVVGQMAAGVAHEIRNPLTALRGFVQLLQSTVKEPRTYFDVMLSELDRINLIVSEFLFLAKPQIVHFEQNDLLVLLKKVVQLLETQAILSNIQIRLDFAPVPWIYCDENQIKQVFVNVLKNAIEAMPRGGEILIQVRSRDEDFVQVRIIDQGCGISQEQIRRLGEPFYTTKEKGTGLGLLVSYQIIEAHKGKIQIESELEKGTTVEVLLPVAKDHGKELEE